MKDAAQSHGFAVWFTGLSGAGKSTLSQQLATVLHERGYPVELLDGDEVRTHLSKGLTYSREDRDVNVARIAFVASLLVKHGVVAITAAISPYAEARLLARQRIGSFFEVYVRCSIEELTRRDVKGLYEQALRGSIDHFTGVSDPYEPPVNPDIIVDSEHQTVEQSLQLILDALEQRGFIEPNTALIS